MSWARMDDGRALNAKMRRVALEALGLDDAAICQAAADLSDGFVSDDTVELLAIAHGCKQWSRPVKRLVDEKRWEREDKLAGYWIHDYLEYNPSRAEVLAAGEQRREAGRAGGLARGRHRSKPPSE